MSLELTVGDTAPTLTGTVNANITGATLELHIQPQGGTAITRTATIVSGPAGTWKADLQAGDLTVSGKYYLEVEVTFSDTTVQTFARTTANQPEFFTVRQQLA